MAETVTPPDTVPVDDEVLPERPYAGTPLAVGSMGVVFGLQASHDMGPRSRVLLLGSATWSQPGMVWATLTEAWRNAGQPLTLVIGDDDGPVERAALAWLGEHEFAGHQAERHHKAVGFGAAAASIRDHAMLAAGAWQAHAFLDGGDDAAEQAATLAGHIGLDVHRAQGVDRG